MRNYFPPLLQDYGEDSMSSSVNLYTIKDANIETNSCFYWMNKSDKRVLIVRNIPD